MHPCDNCGYNAPTVDRTATITDPHTDETESKTFALCDTCADAFDLGAGNA